MITDWRPYGKGAIVGALMGFLLFAFISPLVTLGYYDRLWLLFGCLGMSIVVGCAVALRLDRLADHEWNSWRTHTPHRPPGREASSPRSRATRRV